MVTKHACDNIHSPLAPSVVLDKFEPVSLLHLAEAVQNLLNSYCPLDIVPTKVLKEVFTPVGL